MKKLVLIDGNSLLNRAFYATPVFTTQSGMPTNAIFGFVKLLLKIKDDLNPEYLVVAFDLKAPTFRHTMYNAYKAGRKPMPEELAAQLQPLKTLLKTMNIATCAKEGVEADDIIGTLSKKWEVHSYIYTGDRDSYQLVDGKTDVYYTKRGVSDLLKLNINNFEEILKIKPEQVVDLKALMGDKSDNIPGVPGVGEKTAIDLVTKYGSLSEIYANIDQLKGALKEKLIINEELANLSYKLATIDRNCLLDIELEDCALPKKFSIEVKKSFADLEFKSLLSLNIFDEFQANAILNENNKVEKVLCNNALEIKEIINANNTFGVYFEGEKLSLYCNNKEYEITYSQTLFGEGITYYDFIEILQLIFKENKNTVICYDFKRILYILKDYSVAPCCNFDDLSLAIYLADYSSINLSVLELAEYYGYDKNCPAHAIFSIFSTIKDKLEEENTFKVYNDIEKPLLPILFDMEQQGIKVSIEELDRASEEISNKISHYKKRILDSVGFEFNINSPAQLGEVLFEKLGLKAGKKNKSGKYSTSADILEKLAEENEVVADILKYRQYQKLFSTYVEGIRALIGAKTGLIHTTFNQTITSTGRLSSTNPNLQNIPIREEEGRELRKMFVPKDGNVFIDADYSQIELRLLAHFSGCEQLIEAYKLGIDIHAVTASQVFEVPIEEVTDKMRRDAKAVNFGIIYGISEYGLGKNLNIPSKTAKEYITKYFATYNSVKEYMDSNVEYAKNNGYVATLTGRKRVIPEIKSPNFNTRQFGERAAMNMPLQGSSADIIKIAMIKVYNSLKKNNLKAKLILQVHDELILDCPIEEAEIASKILKDEMENAVKLLVPLTVDVHVGKNWYDAK
ncbi:MAG: DNA polymerase I [Clostridiales bacterium]|nr:DNA polymerase I [Clostridiales bacterium]